MQHLNLVHFNGHIVECNALYWNVCGEEYVCTVDSILFQGGPIVCILDGRRKTQNSISIRIYAFRREYFTKHQYRWESIMLFISNQRALNHHSLASIQMLVSFVVVPDVFLEPSQAKTNRTDDDSFPSTMQIYSNLILTSNIRMQGSEWISYAFQMFES